ncbi:hypothetical protein JHK82_046785 [Glycine max]|nr:hypothetical protein JHK86_046677 [Glycine max]KAG4942591.1 hypothetical protein JHK85_047237 [Glycine max]KAG5096931.1 hypothetical protein JHK82_046785 [Glycine max]
MASIGVRAYAKLHCKLDFYIDLGSAFPLNSNLTAYFSRAILKKTESDLMKEIEENYLGKNDDIGGEDPSAEISSATPSLNFHSFSGLFLITGIATLITLLVSETVIWEKPILIAKAYSQRLDYVWLRKQA